MVNGPTVLGSLRDSEPTIIDSARIIREFEGVMTRLAEKHDKSKNQGSTWNESSLSALTAANVTELTMNENFQQLQDTLLSITPPYVQVVTQITAPRRGSLPTWPPSLASWRRTPCNGRRTKTS